MEAHAKLRLLHGGGFSENSDRPSTPVLTRLLFERFGNSANTTPTASGLHVGAAHGATERLYANVLNHLLPARQQRS